MPDPTLYEQVVARGGFEPPPPKVRASSAVVLWRRNEAGELVVLWVRRAPEMQFMGGWHAFPGGAVARRDIADEGGDPHHIAGAPRGLQPEQVSGAMPESLTHGLGPLPGDGAPGVVTATFRELFEETGILPVVESRGTPPPRERLDAARERLLEERPSFAALLAELGVRLDARRLVFAGRWLTPPFAPLRFDNRFFLLEHRPEDGEPGRSREHTAVEWVRPAEALARWRAGEVIAAPPILHVLRVLADEAVAAGEAAADDTGLTAGALARLRQPLEANLGPFRMIEFRPGIVMFPLATPTLPPATHTNAYLVGGERAVLIDPGTPFPEEIARLEAALAVAAERHGRRVGAIWLTHHHPDHVGAVARLRERLGVPVAAHPATAERLAGRGIAVDETLDEGHLAELPDPYHPGGAPLRLRALHTPGHAPGHLAFYEETRGALFCGDLASAVSTIVIDPPEGDMNAYIQSLARVAALEPATVLPGHGPVLLGAERLRELIDHRLAREARILAAWRRGVRSPEAMLPEIYDDAPRQAWPLAARQIAAHLIRLRLTGELADPAP